MIEPLSYGCPRIVTLVSFWCPCHPIPLGIESPIILHTKFEPHAHLLIMLTTTPSRLPHLWLVFVGFLPISSPLLHPYSGSPSFLYLHSPTLEEIASNVPAIDYLHLHFHIFITSIWLFSRTFISSLSLHIPILSPPWVSSWIFCLSTHWFVPSYLPFGYYISYLLLLAPHW